MCSILFALGVLVGMHCAYVYIHKKRKYKMTVGKQSTSNMHHTVELVQFRVERQFHQQAVSGSMHLSLRQFVFSSAVPVDHALRSSWRIRVIANTHNENRPTLVCLQPYNAGEGNSTYSRLQNYCMIRYLPSHKLNR